MSEEIKNNVGPDGRQIVYNADGSVRKKSGRAKGLPAMGGPKPKAPVLDVSSLGESTAQREIRLAKLAPTDFVDLGSIDMVEMSSIPLQAPVVSDLTTEPNEFPRSFCDMGVFKMHPGVADLEYKTDEAACFDVRAFLQHVPSVKVFSSSNRESQAPVLTQNDRRYVFIAPGARVMMPTGMKLDLVGGTVLKMYARSGQALKQDLVLGNGTAIIDSDYIDELFVIVKNNSDQRLMVDCGERIAQAELQFVNKAIFRSMKTAPTQKTGRIGGFGSTGKH